MIPCPTCGHDATCLCAGSTTVWRCEQCGTVMTQRFTERDGDGFKTYVPKLVERCREFGKALADPCSHPVESDWWAWRRLGIQESIHKPEDR